MNFSKSVANTPPAPAPANTLTKGHGGASGSGPSNQIFNFSVSVSPPPRVAGTTSPTHSGLDRGNGDTDQTVNQFNLYDGPPKYPPSMAPPISQAGQASSMQPKELEIPAPLQKILDFLKVSGEGLSRTAEGYVFTNEWLEQAIKAGIPLKRPKTSDYPEEAKREDQAILRCMAANLFSVNSNFKRHWRCRLLPNEYANIILGDPHSRQAFKRLIAGAKIRGIGFLPVKKPNQLRNIAAASKAVRPPSSRRTVQKKGVT